MPSYTHGGDLYAARQAFAGPVLDFSANRNPLGRPPRVRAAAMAAVDEAVHYPDPLCRALRAGIARRLGVNKSTVSRCLRRARQRLYSRLRFTL